VFAESFRDFRDPSFHPPIHRNYREWGENRPVTNTQQSARRLRLAIISPLDPKFGNKEGELRIDMRGAVIFPRE
jgi:hypothetical protein